MRLQFLLFWFLLLFVQLSAQELKNDTLIVRQVTGQEVALNKGWKYRAEDNPAYAHSNFDDSKWNSIDPTKDIHDLPELKSGVVWLRLKFLIDSAVLNQPLAMIITQVGASEIYINERLFLRFGTIDPNGKKTVAFDPLNKPIALQFLQSGFNVLAIRYALQPDARYAAIRARSNPGFFARLTNMNSAVEQYQKEATRNMSSIIFRIGAFVLLLILHLSFFLYYPAQKANLFFAMFALFVLIAESIATSQPNSVKYIYYHWNAVASFGEVSGFFLLTAIYYLVNRKRGWVYWALLLLTVIGVILTATVYGMGFVISNFLISTIVSLEIVRTAFIAIGNKQRGAWIIAAGAFSYFVFQILFLYLAISGNRLIPLGNTFTLGDLVYNISFLSIPFAASIFLALDFASTSRRLQQKLIEVNQLSEKSLEQEKEKQQILASQKETLEREVTERTAQLKQSLDELKSAQAQLIQSEKMASLGELTAGIAHEIQNPLNFVNNFSDVNTELIDELKQEADKGNIEEVKLIADDIKENEQKINHHGKRADAIVKGMLQHSRASTNKKEPTGINALADEYLRLSYYGFRAKDKSFSATIKPDFDESIGNINVVPQDIGRVILNLITNAFYSVAEKKKAKDLEGLENLQGLNSYEPTVSVNTKKIGDKVLLTVKDNGNGIPQKVLDKIFQPFFTTKPTGQGTGLGLSLSYDIIKAHGGEIKVETLSAEAAAQAGKEGEGAEFIIILSINLQ